MTVKMKKGDLIANINNSPESIAHAYSMGFVPVDRAEIDTAMKAGFKDKPDESDKPEQVNQVPGNTGPEKPSTESQGPGQQDKTGNKSDNSKKTDGKGNK